jgi:hypothetical protein
VSCAEGVGHLLVILTAAAAPDPEMQLVLCAPRVLQACHSSQLQLLHLHNLISHPALHSCLTEQHHEAYSAAVQAFAPAVLKVRSSGRQGRAAVKGSHGTSSTDGRAAVGVGAANVTKPATAAGHSLLQHLQTLAAAAQETSRLTQQVCWLEHKTKQHHALVVWHLRVAGLVGIAMWQSASQSAMCCICLC